MKLFYILKSICITLLLVIAGCEREDQRFFDKFRCEDCYQDKPAMGALNVLLTINDENPYVPLVVYIGMMEDNDIEYVDTSFSKDYWVNVPVDKYYSIAAEYKKGGNTITAVDGSKFKLKYTESNCDKPCYYFSGGYFDLQLRD